MNKKSLLTSGLGLLAVATLMQAPKAEAQRAEVVGVAIEEIEGNKDGKVNPGETVNIRFQLKNVINKTIMPSKATLFTNQRAIRMIQSALKYPAIKPGETATSKNAFVFAVSQEVVDNSIAFYLEVDRGKVLKQTISVSIERPVQRASVEVVRFDIDDSEGGNKDGRLNPGERVTIRFYLKNTGQNFIPPSRTTLFTSQSGINIIDSLATYPGMPPGEIVPSTPTNDTYAFSVDDTVTASSVAFSLTGTFSPDVYEATACVPIFLDILVCVDECSLITVLGPTDELKIRLSVCNRSMSSNPPNPPAPAALPGVAVRIPATSIIICTTGTPLSTTLTPVTTINDMVFYGTIGANSCGDPAACPAQEFRFAIPDGSLSTPSCLWFSAEVWLNAGTNCVIALPAGMPTRIITVYSRI
jgi:hypothetical protein